MKCARSSIAAPAIAVRSLAVTTALAAALVAGAVPALAQQSSSYKLQESVLNAAGQPEQGVFLASSGYRVTLDSVGDTVQGVVISTASYILGGGFVGPYVPPGEVQGLAFSSATDLEWLPEASAGTYNLYRGGIATLPGGFGQCFAPGLGTTSAADMEIPLEGLGFFYLVTAENLLAEEGTKGRSSNGTERPNPIPCP